MCLLVVHVFQDWSFIAVEVINVPVLVPSIILQLTAIQIKSIYNKNHLHLISNKLHNFNMFKQTLKYSNHKHSNYKLIIITENQPSL